MQQRAVDARAAVRSKVLLDLTQQRGVQRRFAFAAAAATTAAISGGGLAPQHQREDGRHSHFNSLRQNQRCVAAAVVLEVNEGEMGAGRRSATGFRAVRKSRWPVPFQGERHDAAIETTVLRVAA